MKSLKTEGITLIALVITIIVMLILVAVTVNYSIKSNLLSKVNTAKTATELAELKDKAEGYASKFRVNYYSSNSDTTKLVREYVIEQFANGKEGIIDSEYKYTIDDANFLVIKDLNDNFIAKAIIKEDGTIEIKEGNVEKDIHIKTVEDLKWLAQTVNSGKTLEGYTIYLDNDLDLGARPNEQGEWNIPENDQYTWKPIGDELNVLKAPFLGQNYTIKGLYITGCDFNAGLFGQAVCIKDLTVQDGYIDSKMAVGGICGLLRGDGALVSNCHNKNVEVNGGTYVGGLLGTCLGQNVVLENCSNSGNVYSYSGRCGGITSDGNISRIENCYNIGNVTGEKSYVGGIAASIEGQCAISNCYNKGNIKGKKNVGGLVGYFSGRGNYENNLLKECYNEGKIIGESCLGGLVGAMDVFYLSKSYNKGEVYASADDTGGIAGVIFKGILEECYNEGTIQGSYEISGIVGQIGADADAYIRKCYNKGEVKAKAYVGGILGWASNTGTMGKVENNYNIGTITGTELVGGAIGRYTPSTCKIVIENNYTLKGVAPTNGDYNIEKEETEMKNDEFINLLRKEGWKIDSVKNNGYPILNWQ